MIITTIETVPGMKIRSHCGLVSGSTVRSKNAIKDFGAGLKNIVGGELKSYTELLTEAREEASRLTAKAQAEIAREKTEALNEIRNEIADLAVLAASKVVGKTIDVADHQNMVNNFVKEVGEAK